MRLYTGPYGEPCKNCGKYRSDWRRDDPRQLYCSIECRLAYYKKGKLKIMVRCINTQCSRLFKPHRITQKYCTDRCKSRAQNHRFYMRHKATMKARVLHYRWKIKTGLHKPMRRDKL